MIISNQNCAWELKPASGKSSSSKIVGWTTCTALLHVKMTSPFKPRGSEHWRRTFQASVPVLRNGAASGTGSLATWALALAKTSSDSWTMYVRRGSSWGWTNSPVKWQFMIRNDLWIQHLKQTSTNWRIRNEQICSEIVTCVHSSSSWCLSNRIMLWRTLNSNDSHWPVTKTTSYVLYKGVTWSTDNCLAHWASKWLEMISSVPKIVMFLTSWPFLTRHWQCHLSSWVTVLMQLLMGPKIVHEHRIGSFVAKYDLFFTELYCSVPVFYIE